jgi:hypothetical protein
MTQYRIKGWNKFQHFKDRRPPWIKLYRDLLDDMDWHELDGDCAKTLISLWLIASENEGQLPDMRKLAFRLRMSEKALSAQISQLDHWLEVSDNEPISARYQDDAPETETETETETEIHCPEKVPDGVPEGKTAFEEFWKAYPRTPNMSKVAALKAWERQKCSQLPQDQLLSAVAKYKAFLAAETKKNGREYPAKHAQGWISERRWESYWDQQQSQQNSAKHETDWADKIPQWHSFKSGLAPTEWAMWFKTSHPNGSIETLVAPSAFAAAKIEERYGSRLQAHFGEGFNIKVGKND